MAHHTRYLVSAQSNRNLVLDRNDLKWFDNLTDADTEAVRRARKELVPVYVHVVQVTLARSHVPVVQIESTDTP